MGRTEAKLIRISHFLWGLYLQASEEAGMEDALRTVWVAKSAHRAELKAQRKAAARKLREYWETRAAA